MRDNIKQNKKGNLSAKLTYGKNKNIFWYNLKRKSHQLVINKIGNQFKYSSAECIKIYLKWMRLP